MKRSSYCIIIGLSLLTISCFSQEWIFEYEAEENALTGYGWMLPEGQGSFHTINIAGVPGSLKDIRGRLIQLDDEGNVVSLFQPRNCEVYNYYLPFKEDKVITIGPDCNDLDLYSITLFDGQGKRIWYQPVEEKYYANYIVHYKDDISFIQQQWAQENADEFLISTLDKNLVLTSKKISLKQIKSPGHKMVMNRAIQTGKEEYLLSVQIYDVDQNSVINHLYSKLVLVNKGNIQWIKNLQQSMLQISCLGKVEGGYLIAGRDTNSLPLVMLFDLHGNETKRFAPMCASKGFYSSFYCTGKSLMVVDKRVRGTTLFLSSFALDGQLQWERSIPTTYARFEGAQIVGSDDDSFLVSAIYMEASSVTSQAFVMKFNFKNIITDTLISIEPLAKTFTDDIIDQVDNEVSSVRVYPNPTQFDLTFEIDNGNEQTEYILMLYDESGQQVLQQRNIGRKFSVDVSQLTPAFYVYAIKTVSGKRIISGKILKN